MNTQTSTIPSIYERIGRIEKELQRLKIETYLNLPPKERSRSRYPENAIMRVLKATREEIWRKRYASKVARLR